MDAPPIRRRPIGLVSLDDLVDRLRRIALDPLPDDVPVFAPFRATRYQDSTRTRTAPPYDVIDESEAAELRARDQHNIVNLDLPTVVGDASSAAHASSGETRAAHNRAARVLEGWLRSGILVTDPDPAYYIYRQGYRDSQGDLHQTTGVVGALAIGADGVLPHEETTPKASSDRLVSLEETRTNLSMIYAMSLAPDLVETLEPSGPPLISDTDDEGVHHRIWAIRSPALVETITKVVDSAPVVIADGHHRYTVACEYLDAVDANVAPGARRIMTFVVPLDPTNLVVRPIHRVLPDVDLGGRSLESALTSIAEVTTVDPGATEAATAPGAVVVVTRDARWACRPVLRPEDSARLDEVPETTRALDVTWVHRVLMPELGAAHAVFHHCASNIIARVENGEADVGVLVAAVGVDEIERVAATGGRMPPKTTFFWPKARTGLLLRRLDETDIATNEPTNEPTNEIGAQ